MNATIFYLIVTMSSNTFMTYQGYGGISVTPVSSYEVCLELKEDVFNQLKRTPHIDMRDVVLECRKY